MKLKLFSNEVLMKCIQFRHVWKIFYTFVQLNSRSSKLIGNIVLHINHSQSILTRKMKNRCFSLNKLL